MIGADIYTIGDAVHLSFRGSRQWNHLQLALDSSDTYRMVFIHTERPSTYQDIGGVHAEQLADVFQSTTGLDTHL